MGLAKLVVDVQSLATMLLEDSTNRLVRMSNTGNLPSDSKILVANIEDDKIKILLSHPALPEPEEGGWAGFDSLIESNMEVEVFETTPDQQLRLDRYEIELRNVAYLTSIAKSLPEGKLHAKLVELTTRVLAVLRHEDPDKVLQVAGGEISDEFRSETKTDNKSS